MTKTKILMCPVCGGKTRDRIRADTTLTNFPLFCPKCKRESLVDVRHSMTTVIREPDAIGVKPYMFAPYILADNPEMSASEAITASKELTDGHKGELFVLLISFFPWLMVGTLTLGLGYIYVLPYVQATITNTYYRLKKVTVKMESDR